jgi:hypothetical protein
VECGSSRASSKPAPKEVLKLWAGEWAKEGSSRIPGFTAEQLQEEEVANRWTGANLGRVERDAEGPLFLYQLKSKFLLTFGVC